MVMLRDVAKLTPRWNTESAERDNMVGNNKTNENQIRTLIENWAKAVREGDIDGVLANHTDYIVMFDVPLPAYWARVYGSKWR